MSKEYMIAYLQTAADLETHKEAKEMVDAILDSMTEELADGGEVILRGFGHFTVRKRAERTGRNPRTGEKLVIPAHNAVHFSPGSELKEAGEASGTGFDWLSGKDFMRSASDGLAELKKRFSGEAASKYYHQTGRRLSDAYEETRYKLTLLRKGGGGAWDELRRGFEGAYSELKDAFKRALKKF